MEEKWLYWAKQLQAIAQAGLEYSKDKYDLERFEQIRELSVEILHEYTDVSKEKIKTLFCNEKGYQTPKVDIRAAIFKDDKILMVKESLDGCWSLPGGWAEVNLSVNENIVKEAREEAGVNVKPKRIIAILERNRHNTPPNPYGIYKIFVLCELIGGAFEENIETEESGYFVMTDLPPLSIDRITKEQIEMCFKAYVNENFITIFD
jgi:ADP-ribose pyrophosphatase YjhB (NUDIX family)